MPGKRPLEEDDEATDSGRPKRSRTASNRNESAKDDSDDDDDNDDGPVAQARNGKRTSDYQDWSDDDEDGKVGIIESITLKNFMCHTSLEVALDSNLNFIVGRNGSGKSAVMTALTVGLGGRARDTSRGASVKNFIKAGTHFAEVSIILSNGGNDAFKPEIYGEKIIVERRFTHTSSTYKLKSATGQTMSNKGDEVSRMLDHFNVQVDNPICMLNQDTSRNFLFSKKAEDKYNFFLKATELEKMTEEYEMATNCHAEALEFIQNKKETMPHLEAELKVWEKKAKAFASIDDLRSKVNTLKNELVWTLVSQDEKKLAELERSLKESGDRRPAHERKVEESQQILDKAKEDKKELEATVGSITQKRDEYDEKLKVLGRNKGTKMADKTKAESKVRSLTKEISNLEKEKKLLEDRIASILEQNSKDFSDEKRQREEQIQGLEIQMAEIKSQMATTEHQLDQFNRCINKYKEDLFVRQREHGEKSNNIRSLRAEITKFKKSKNDKWVRFGDWVPKVKQDIQTALRRNEFTAEPRGPIGAYLTLKHEEYALSIEQCLGAQLRTWICDNSKDLAVLEKIIKKHTGQVPNFSVSKFFDRKHDISRHQADNSSYPSLFDLVDIADPVVFNHVVDSRGCENVLFILDSDEARPILQRNPPAGCKEAFTKFGDQIYAGGPGGSYRYYSAEANLRVRFLVADNAAAVAVMEDEARQLEADLDGVAQGIKAMQGEMEQNKRAKVKDEQRMNKLRSSLAKLQTTWSDLRAIEDPMPIDVTTLREDLDNHSREIVDKSEEREEYKREQKTKQEAYQKEAQAFETIQTELLNLVTNSESDALKLSQLLLEYPKMQSTIAHYQQKLRQLDDDIGKRRNERDEQKALVSERIKKAEGVCPRVRAKRTPQHLQQEIIQIEKRIATEEEAHGDKEVVLASYREKKSHVEGIKQKVAGLTNFATIFTQVMNNRVENMSVFKRLLAQRTRAFFAHMLNERKYRGQLKFNHEKGTLDIHVQPQADANQQGDMRQLSGGERSFSTVCFVLSLWEAMESPFRCLDEFDVFMDNVNRSIAMKMMTATTQKHKHQQFIFLTPLDMSQTELRDQSNLKIFKMPDPER